MSLIDFTAEDCKEELCVQIGNWIISKFVFILTQINVLYLEISYKNRISINNFILLVLL